MRIRSGGPHQTRGAKGTSEAKGVGKTAGTRFSGMVEATDDATKEKSKKLRSAMMEQMMQLAAELEAGNLTDEKLADCFVDEATNHSFRDKDGKGPRGKGIEDMKKTVAGFVGSDPDFMNRLKKNLKKLAKS